MSILSRIKSLGCHFHSKPKRADLPPLTPRIAALPVDERGYPVPFFVCKVDGKYDFRVTDGVKWVACVKQKLCWVCGQPLGSNKAFVIGPMCAVNRTSAEPPSHLECAEWSVRGCPFITRPHMVRREDDKIAELEAANPSAGIPIKRNPGVTAIWTTRSYKIFSDGGGGRLVRFGDPLTVSWWREGRKATREEIMESVRTGMPLLRETCQGSPEAEAALGEAYAVAVQLIERTTTN